MIQFIIIIILCLCCCSSVIAGLQAIDRDLKKKKRGKNSSNNKSSNESFEINELDGQVNKNENIKWHN